MQRELTLDDRRKYNAKWKEICDTRATATADAEAVASGRKFYVITPDGPREIELPRRSVNDEPSTSESAFQLGELGKEFLKANPFTRPGPRRTMGRGRAPGLVRMPR